MNAQQLKNAILQEAIEGRLVPQDPNDEPASALLERILKEKEELVKAGKLKKKDLEVKPISEDEIPFDIPESWEWVRLGDVCDYLHRGKSPKYGSQKELPIIAQKCNQWDRIYTDRCLFSDRAYIDKYTLEQYLQVGDVLINSTGGGTVGRTGYVDTYVFDEYHHFVADSHVTVVRGNKLVDSKFIYFYLISPYIQWGLEDRCSGSTNQIELGTSTISNYILPLPPLAEQRRIVAKIEKLMPKVEEYGKAQEKLNKLNEELPERLKKSVLQEAIEGRLVPQDPNDEPASALLAKIREEKKQLVKEGKLKKKDLEENPISEDEIPFEIPESWEWCKLGTIASLLGGFAFKSHEYTSVGSRVIRISDITEEGFVEKNVVRYPYNMKLNSYVIQAGDILMAMTGGTVGKSLYVKTLPEEKMLLNQRVANIRAISVYTDYIDYVIKSHHIQSIITDAKNSTNDNISMADIYNFPIPLPPFAEQYRIVEKIEQLFKEVDKLKK